MQKTELSISSDRPLHRLRRVRLSEGISVRALARRLNRRVSEIKDQENEFADITLSELYRWQQELQVPLSDLLAEPEDRLSESVKRRACMLRMAKTAKSLLRQNTDKSTHRLAQNLMDQIMVVMPELQEVTPWHEVGTRRSLDEPSRLEERRISVDHLFRDGMEE